MALLDGYKINIHIPCQRMPLQPLQWADVSSCAPSLEGIVDYLRQSYPFARLGNYDGNFEIEIGFEGFTPREQSSPTHGQEGKPSILPSLTLTTYVTERVDDERLESFLNGIRERHPWEHPVMIVSAARIFVPDSAV